MEYINEIITGTGDRKRIIKRDFKLKEGRRENCSKQSNN
jgi:hypothetical protein